MVPIVGRVSLLFPRPKSEEKGVFRYLDDDDDDDQRKETIVNASRIVSGTLFPLDSLLAEPGTSALGCAWVVRWVMVASLAANLSGLVTSAGRSAVGTLCLSVST